MHCIYSLTENQINDVFILGGIDDIQVLLDNSIVSMVKTERDGGRVGQKDDGK